jgi:hypothetical protein
MRKDEVPQDAGLLGELKEVFYALDEDGRYVLAESAGWEPANIANRQAWEELERQSAAVLAAVRRGELSPLAYHMARHQMDEKMLASYAGLYRWQVRRHCKPAPFARLKPETLSRYAAVFRIPVEELTPVPRGGETNEHVPREEDE